MSISKTVMNAIDKMDIATLSQLQALINERKTDLAYEVRNTLKVGDEVKVNHKKLAGYKCTITAIRLKRVTVKASYGMSYNVPMTMIEPVKLSKAEMKRREELMEACADTFTKWG
jgi:hypothetical protein